MTPSTNASLWQQSNCWWSSERPGHTWGQRSQRSWGLRAVKNDLKPLNLGLTTAWRKATNWNDWRAVVDTATLKAWRLEYAKKKKKLMGREDFFLPQLVLSTSTIMESVTWRLYIGNWVWIRYKWSERQGFSMSCYLWEMSCERDMSNSLAHVFVRRLLSVTTLVTPHITYMYNSTNTAIHAGFCFFVVTYVQCDLTVLWLSSVILAALNECRCWFLFTLISW